MEAARNPRRARVIAAVASAVAVLSGVLIACGPMRSSGADDTPAAASMVAVEPRLPAPPATVRPAVETSDDPTSTTSTEAPATTTPVTTVPPALPDVDAADPAVAGRSLPPEVEAAPDPAASSPWATFTTTAASGRVATDVGCTAGTSADALDAFFAERVGPVLGWDYQHVYPLGGDRYLWLFQDVFIDRTGTSTSLGNASFVHNAALVQSGNCFSLQHGGTPTVPLPFEAGDGTGTERATWYWPLGGEVSGGRLWVFWAKMQKDGYDPAPPDGLGWHPTGTYLASYDRTTLARLSFGPAPNSGASPLYGYAVASDGTYSYLFGNTFEQNLVREGGYANAPHSATTTWLARVPQGQLWGAPEYRTADGWSPDPAAAVPIQGRFAVEDPMQPRFVGNRWVSVSKVDGYWGDDMVVDTALDPWGPWVTTERFRLVPRAGDPARNTYHAFVLPWLARDGSLLVAVSNNARNMRRDAWPHPERYRPMVFARAMPAPLPPPTTVPVDTLPVDTLPVDTGAVTDTSVAAEPATATTAADTTTNSTTSTNTTTPPTTTPPTTTAAPTTTLVATTSGPETTVADTTAASTAPDSTAPG
jgi:hypothetical protein